MAKHTPGPWHVVGNVPCIASDIGGDNPKVICRIELKDSGFVFEPDYEVRNANARLIAAAPDLLAVLKDLYALADQVVPGTYNGWRDVEARVQEVLAIAEGIEQGAGI